MAWASKGPSFADILKQRQQREKEEKEAAEKEAKLRLEEAKKAKAEADRIKAEEAKAREERSLGTRPRFGPGHSLPPAQPTPVVQEARPQNVPEVKKDYANAVVKEPSSSNENKTEASSESKEPVSEAKVPPVTPVTPVKGSKSSPGPSTPTGKEEVPSRSSPQKDGPLPSSSSSATSLTPTDAQSSNSPTEEKKNSLIKPDTKSDKSQNEKEDSKITSASVKTDAKAPSVNKPVQKPVVQNGVKQDTARRKNEGGGDAGYYYKEDKFYNGYKNNRQNNGYGYERQPNPNQYNRIPPGYNHNGHQQAQSMPSWGYQDAQQIDGNGYSYQQQGAQSPQYPYYDNSGMQYYQPVTEITTRNGPLFINPMFSNNYPYYDASQGASFGSGDATNGHGYSGGHYDQNGTSQGYANGYAPAPPATPSVIKSFYFDSDYTGFILGKGGQYVKDEQFRYQCKIWIDEENTHKQGYSILYIHGMNENVDAAAHHIHHRLESAGGKLFPVVGVHSENVLYPQLHRLSLPLNVALNAYVTHVEDTTVFIQQPSHPTYSKLIGLEPQLAKHCSDVQVPLIDIHHSPVDKGCYVVAPVNDTDQWLRAMVLSPSDEEGMILLRSLDHGFPFSVPATGLKLLQTEFCTTPVQAIECKLISGRFDSSKTLPEQINHNIPATVNKQWVKVRAVGKDEETGIPVIEMWINPCG